MIAKEERWMVVYLDADVTGLGSDGKDADFALYPFADKGEAQSFADKVSESEILKAQSYGGYPGFAEVIDLQDEISFGNPAEFYFWQDED